MTALEVYAQGDRQTLRTLHVLDNAPALIPDLFRDKETGQVRWGEVVVAARAATIAGLDPVVDLKHFPVIRGQVFPMAEIWRVMARRHGWTVATPVDTADKVVVTMANRLTGERPPDFTMTMVEARQLGNAATNNLYTTIPRNMLRARATMTAIRLNCPDVLRDPAVAGWQVDTDLTAGQATRPPAVTAAAIDPEPPPGLAAATINPDDVAAVTAALAVLSAHRPDIAEHVRARWKQKLPGVTLATLTTTDQLLLAAILAVEGILDAATDLLPDETPDDDDYEGRPFDDGPERPEEDPDRADDAGVYRYDPEAR